MCWFVSHRGEVLRLMKKPLFPLRSAETHTFYLTDMRYPWAQMEGHFDPLQIFT